MLDGNLVFDGAIAANGTLAGAPITAASAAIALATLAAGAELLNISVPGVIPQTGTLPRYLRLSYAVGTAIFSVGSVISAIIFGRDSLLSYPTGIKVTN